MPRKKPPAPPTAEPAPVPPVATPTITRLSLDEVRMDPANARKHDERNRGVIRGSLRRFGPGRSIVLDGKNIVRAGNGTLAEARAEGYTEILVVEPKPGQLLAVRRPEWSPTEAAGYSLADNQATDTSENDPDILAGTLNGLFTEDPSLALATGFTQSDLDAMLSDLDPGPTTGDPKEDPSPTADLDVLVAKWGTALGQRWEIPSHATGGSHWVVCGDACDPQTQALAVQSEPAAMVFADPPYGQDYYSKHRPIGERFARLANDDRILTDWAGPRRRVFVRVVPDLYVLENASGMVGRHRWPGTDAKPDHLGQGWEWPGGPGKVPGYRLRAPSGLEPGGRNRGETDRVRLDHPEG